MAGLDGAGQRLGLPGHRNSHQWTSSYRGYIKYLIHKSPVDSDEDLITSTFEAAVTIRQQPGTF